MIRTASRETDGLWIKNLSLSHGETPVFAGVTLHLQPREILCLTGPSGCGKSQFLHAVAELRPYDGGELTLDGDSPDDIGIPDWRSRVLYVTQSRVNFKGTPSDLFNLAKGFSVNENRDLGNLESIAGELGLSPAVLEQAWSQLSGGQAQRASVAIGIALEPQILLLDEPTSACDPASAHLVEKAIRIRVDGGLSAIWVTHDHLQPERIGARSIRFPPPPPAGGELPEGAVADLLSEVAPGPDGMCPECPACGHEEHPHHLGISSVALSTLAVCVCIYLSFWNDLHLEGRLGVACARAIVQLSLLGLILGPIFRSNAWWLCIAYQSFMIWVAAREVTARPTHTYKGMMGHVWATLGAAGGATLWYGLLFVVHVGPLRPQYAIPILGMILGNSINGVSLALTTLVDETLDGKDRLEALLAYGGTRWEAARVMMRRTLSLALTPIVNQLSVIGLVSIPGMMTGQILAGLSPTQAARYQLCVMFMIATATALSVVMITFLFVHTVVDERHRLREERLVLKDTTPHPLVAAAAATASEWAQGAQSAARGVWEAHLRGPCSAAFGWAGRRAGQAASVARGGYGRLREELGHDRDPAPGGV